MANEPEAVDGDTLSGGLGSAWRRLAPLSIGAVTVGALIVTGGVLLRGLLGSRRRFLGGLSAAALLSVGLVLRLGERKPDSERPAERAGPPPERSGMRQRPEA
jgi:hypothetical protein